MSALCVDTANDRLITYCEKNVHWVSLMRDVTPQLRFRRFSVWCRSMLQNDSKRDTWYIN